MCRGDQDKNTCTFLAQLICCWSWTKFVRSSCWVETKIAKSRTKPFRTADPKLTCRTDMVRQGRNTHGKMKSLQNCLRFYKFVSVRISPAPSLKYADSGATRASFDHRRRKKWKQNSKGKGIQTLSMREKDQKPMHVPSHKTLQITSANCDRRGHVKAMCLALGGGVHSHSRCIDVTEVGDSPQIEVARVQSDRWIFAIMDKYPTTNDTDFAVSSSSLIELNASNFDVRGVHE